MRRTLPDSGLGSEIPVNVTELRFAQVLLY